MSLSAITYIAEDSQINKVIRVDQRKTQRIRK